MKIRTGKIRCERCKQLMPLGSSALRFHGRLWHTTCVIEWNRERATRREMAKV